MAFQKIKCDLAIKLVNKISSLCLKILIISIFYLTSFPLFCVPDEYLAKARFLKLTIYYTEFPSNSTQGNQPWRIGIIGDSNFEGAFAEVFKPQETVRGRAVNLIYIKSIDKIPDDIDVAFICKSEVSRLKDILERLKGRSVLTVGDTPGFAQRGVMVNFFVFEGFLRTEVNLLVARQSRLDFNSSFLRISRIVNR